MVPIRTWLIGCRGWHWKPWLVANLFYLAAWAIVVLIFGVMPKPTAILLDVVSFNTLALLIFLCARQSWVACGLLALLTAVFLVGSGAKMALLGRPIMPEDVHSVVALVRIMGLAGWFLVALPLALPALLLVANLRLTGVGARTALAVLCLTPLLLASAAPAALRLADRHIGNAPWDQRQNFVERGPTLHILQETLRAYTLREPPPTQGDVAAALDRLQQAADRFPDDMPATVYRPVSYGARPLRNVHVLLLESFWDPTPLLDPEKPILDPRFYALWDAAGRSTTLSPTFSGGTANAEFEILCGFPIDSWAVKYELGFNAAPCLPDLLRQSGYRTVASHPNDAGFWNRASAYPRLGFETFWAKPDFAPDDMIAWMLSDRSLYRQIAAKLATEGNDRPVFNFVVTLYGHWTYDMVPERPAIVPINPDQAELGQFATAMYYKSVELMDEIARLRRDDPDALIVAFGDHLPNLGYNWGGYKNHGFFQGGWGDFSAEMYLRSRETPLLVIDGANGPLRVGQQPLYRLNGLIRDRLDFAGTTIADLVPPPEQLTLRPVPDSLLGLDADGLPFLCKPTQRDGNCAAAATWLADVKLITRDVFDGNAHALTLPAAIRHPVTAASQ